MVLPEFGPTTLGAGARSLRSDANSGRRRQHLSVDMTGTRIGLAVLLIGALAAGFSFLRKETIAESHRQARQLILYYTLSRVERPHHPCWRQHHGGVHIAPGTRAATRSSMPD